jgi:signal transduction histidine kinase
MEPNLHLPKVLLVDDDERNLRLLKGILFTEPYKILMATSGNEALDQARAHHPSLILLDIMMPGLSGFDVCQQLKSSPETRMIPVVMVTALNEVSDRVQAMEAGADDFLSKPVDATELIVRVRSLIRMYQLHTAVEYMTAERLRFMAGVAHDIRSPLNALMLSLDSLSEKVPQTAQTERLLGRINTCIDHIQILAEDIMNYYKIEAGQLELDLHPHSVPEVVEDVLSIAMPIAQEKGLAFEIAPMPDITQLMDKNAITQVLLNLLTNAVKYTNPPGTITLRVYDLSQTAYHIPGNHYPPLLTLPINGVVFEVCDTGQGIAPADYERIFREFDRLKTPFAETEGIGLGLAVSQRLVRLHDGELWFTSEVAKGTCFALFLP